MNIRSKIRGAAPAKRKRAKLLVQNGFKCQKCGRKILQIKTIQKYRRLVGRGFSKGKVRWLMPCGIECVCYYATVQHKLSKWKGGTHKISNLEAWCWICNKEHSSQEHKQFKADRRYCVKCGAIKAMNRYNKCYRCRFGTIQVSQVCVGSFYNRLYWLTKKDNRGRFSVNPLV